MTDLPDSAAVLLREFRSLLTSGGAELAMLVVESDDQTTQWFLSRNRFEEYVSDGAWSSWFHSPAWNHTWVVTDRHLRQVTLLCLTDLD